MTKKALNNKLTGKLSKRKDYPTLDKIKKWGGYVSMGIAIFSTGYVTGQYISDLKCTENNIKTIGEFQKERETLQNELNMYRFSNVNYATKEELEELKLNLEKFSKLLKNE